MAGIGVMRRETSAPVVEGEDATRRYALREGGRERIEVLRRAGQSGQAHDGQHGGHLGSDIAVMQT